MTKGEGMITIEAGVLARAMKYAAGIVESSQTIPILANARLSASGDTLQVTTSDLDTELRQDLPLAVPGEMATTVDARRLSMLASAVEAGSQIEIKLDGRMTVRSGRSRWVLPVLPVDDFPNIPFDVAPVETEIAGADLARAIDRVIWAVDPKHPHFFLQGPMLHGEDGKVALVGTDKHVLARAITSAAFPEGGSEVILSAKFAGILGSLCADAKSVTLTWDAGKVRAVVGDVQIIGKLISGTYPDYRRVMPVRAGEPMTIDPAILRSALRRVQLVSTEKTRAVKWEPGNDKLALSVSGADAGEAREELPASCTEGSATGFNTTYLDRMAEAVGGDTIAVHHAEATAPALFERTVPDGMLCVVMPMRV